MGSLVTKFIGVGNEQATGSGIKIFRVDIDNSHTDVRPCSEAMLSSSTLADLYDAHAAGVFGFLVVVCGSKSEAEDALQDLFVKVGRGMDSLEEIRDPRAWLLTAARRVAIDRHRRTQARRIREKQSSREAELAPIFPAESDPDRELFRSELESALATLPSEQREVVALKLWGDHTFAEIAEVCGCSPNTAASRYRYGLDKLRDQLRPLYDEIRES